MATATANFDKFLIFYYSSYPLNAYYEALIYCYNAGSFVGRIEFYKPETGVDALKSTIVNNQPWVRYRIDRFDDVHRILIQEKPLYLHVNDANGIGTLATADFEPTGEEE
jgi:hypothetical protein